MSKIKRIYVHSWAELFEEQGLRGPIVIHLLDDASGKCYAAELQYTINGGSYRYVVKKYLSEKYSLWAERYNLAKELKTIEESLTKLNEEFSHED